VSAIVQLFLQITSILLYCFVHRMLVCVERLSTVPSSSYEINNTDGLSVNDRDEEDIDGYNEFVSVSYDRLDNTSLLLISVDSPDTDCLPLVAASDQSAVTSLPAANRETTDSDLQSKSAVAAAKSETLPIAVKSDAPSVSGSSSGSQSALGKVGSGMPPVARKIINSSSALFQRKKQAIIDHKKFSVAHTLATGTVSNSEPGPVNNFTSVSYNSLTKSVVSSPAVCSTPEVNKSASSSSVAVTAAGKSLSASTNILPAAVDTATLSSESSLANVVDMDSSSSEQFEGRRPSSVDNINTEGVSASVTSMPDVEKKSSIEHSPAKSPQV